MDEHIWTPRTQDVPLKATRDQLLIGISGGEWATVGLSAFRREVLAELIRLAARHQEREADRARIASMEAELVQVEKAWAGRLADAEAELRRVSAERDHLAGRETALEAGNAALRERLGNIQGETEMTDEYAPEVVLDSIRALAAEGPTRRLEVENAALREATKAGEFDAVLSDYLMWSLRQFPSSTPASVAAHIRKEAAELADDPTSAEELADIVALAFHSAARQGHDLTATLAAKLPILKARAWGEPDAEGVVEHVR